MFNHDFMFREVFVIMEQPDVKKGNSVIGIVRSFGQLLRYIRATKINVSGIESASIYHGVIIPANYIHAKINDLAKVHVLGVDNIIGDQKNFRAKETDFFVVRGTLYEVLPFCSLSDINKYISGLILTNKFDITDVFMMLGYKVDYTSLADMDDELDEAELLPRLTIAKEVQNTLELLQNIQDTVAMELVVDGEISNRYKPIEHLISTYSVEAHGGIYG